MVFGADLIAGFPTETEAMFEDTLAIVDECQLTYLHVFPFSPRPGTPAARMPQVERATIKERAARLRDKGNTCLQHFLTKQIGSAVGRFAGAAQYRSYASICRSAVDRPGPSRRRSTCQDHW